jgi:uncharacterized membrane protein
MRAAIEILPEETLRNVVDLLVRLVEAAGAAVIFVGAVIGVVKFLAALPRRNPEEFVPVRLSLGRYLALGLEFQLASDVLRTAIAPSFQELGKLAAVAAIRTALNFFLAREIHEEREQVAEKQRAPGAPSSGSASTGSASSGSASARPAPAASAEAGPDSAGSAPAGPASGAAPSRESKADSVYSRAVRAGTRAGLVRHAGLRAAREGRADLAEHDGAEPDGRGERGTPGR